MINSRKLFDDSEAAHPIEPEEYIPVENIRGHLLLIGAEDDVLWDTAKYIRRMEKRLAEKCHECEVEAVVYAHGTHFVFPEGMLKTMLPVGSALFIKWAFKAAGKYPRECRATRIDIEKRMCMVLAEWTGASGVDGDATWQSWVNQDKRMIGRHIGEINDRLHIKRKCTEDHIRKLETVG